MSSDRRGGPRLDKAEVAKRIAAIEKLMSSEPQKPAPHLVVDTYPEMRSLVRGEVEDTISLSVRKLRDHFVEGQGDTLRLWGGEAVSDFDWAARREGPRTQGRSLGREVDFLFESNHGKWFVKALRSGRSDSVSADVQRQLEDRFGAEITHWLSLSAGPSGDAVMLADLEYVVARLDRLMASGLIKTWLTSVNDRLNCSPVEAIAMRQVGEVVAAMDADTQGSY